MSQKRKSSAEKFVVVTEPPQTLRVAVLSFLAGAGLMWLGMHFLASVPDAPPKVVQAAPGTPDVSQLSPAQAALSLGNWEYDQKRWPAAVLQYERAIQAGIDTADLHTDLGTAYRYLGEASKALDQYALAQRKDRFHQNSLFNQAIVYAELLHDRPKAIATAREFLRRFPQSQGAASARKLISDLEGEQATVEKKLDDLLRTPATAPAVP